MAKSYDVAIIGGGPGGYVAAIRCAQLGLNTACIDGWSDEKGKPSLGGTCLNIGCIPSKALLESSEHYHRINHELAAHGIQTQKVSIDIATMMQRKDEVVKGLTGGVAMLLKANKVTHIHGHGCLLDGRQIKVTPVGKGKKSETIHAQHIILATGSQPVELAIAPIDNAQIVDSSGALKFASVPKRLGIIGSGVIGLELGSVWRRLGSEVVILEAQEEFLSMADRDIARDALKAYRGQGLDIRMGARLLATSQTKKQVTLTYSDSNGEQQLEVDRLVVAVGRRPATEGLCAAASGLLINGGGFIHVDEQCETNLPGVYAIGDLVRGPMLAHKASEEGVAVAETIAGGSGHVNYDTIPSVIYTNPEIAWVGRSEAALKAAGESFNVGTFPFAANGRARAMNSTKGQVKIIAHSETDRILGVHIIGPGASELIAEAVLAMEFSASAEDLARTVHAHPTLSEAVHEAALAVSGAALHQVKR
ncbi:MAG: dihydrolipoyl dehydrogenase [Gammaproteobacteria bacterium]|nr:dihydrolipoyl dehydrogenase [Gammaproteobacteria bacterium]